MQKRRFAFKPRMLEGYSHLDTFKTISDPVQNYHKALKRLICSIWLDYLPVDFGIEVNQLTVLGKITV